MQGTQVQSLIRKDPWACALEPRSCNSWAHMPQLLKPSCPRTRAPQQEKTLQWEACILQLESSPCSLQLEKSPSSKNKEPTQPKINKKLKKNQDLNEFKGTSREESPGWENKTRTYRHSREMSSELMNWSGQRSTYTDGVDPTCCRQVG